jgi:hypothetical protein
MLRGAAGPAPFEAERVDLVLRGDSPGRDLAWADLGAGALWTSTREPSGLVGPLSASALPFALPSISMRQFARSSAISMSIGAYSIPRTSSTIWAKPAGQPPASPPKIAWSASRWPSSARSSMKNPITGFPSPVQTFPVNEPTAATFSPSSETSP